MMMRREEEGMMVVVVCFERREGGHAWLKRGGSLSCLASIRSSCKSLLAPLVESNEVRPSCQAVFAGQAAHLAMLAFGYPGLVLVKPTGRLGGRDPCPSKTQGLGMFFDFFTDVCPAFGQGRDECFVEGEG
jgi:hypothetical protein